MEIADAKLCIRLSTLAYSDNTSKNIDQLKSLGFNHVKFFTKDSAQAYVVHNETNVYVIFRGTELTESKDILALINFAPRRAAAGGKVHSGLAEAVDLIWKEVEHYLDGEVRKYGMEKNVVFTGHSMGGSMAVISAQRSHYIAKVFTFGALRVGNKDFAAGILSIVYQFRNENDGIPLWVPPFGYSHCGINLRLFDGKIYSRASVSLTMKIIWSKVRRLRFWNSLIGDHRALEYVKRLDKTTF